MIKSSAKVLCKNTIKAFCDIICETKNLCRRPLADVCDSVRVQSNEWILRDSQYRVGYDEEGVDLHVGKRGTYTYTTVFICDETVSYCLLSIGVMCLFYLINFYSNQL